MESSKNRKDLNAITETLQKAMVKRHIFKRNDFLSPQFNFPAPKTSLNEIENLSLQKNQPAITTAKAQKKAAMSNPTVNPVVPMTSQDYKLTYPINKM